MFKKAIVFVGRSLILKKGFRKSGLILWFIIMGVISLAYDCLTADKREAYVKSMDYQAMCSNGEFEKAHLVKAKYYKDYSKELGRWRSGAWRDRQAREAQEIYQATASYIFAKEVVAIYDRNKVDNAQKVINLLIAIPVDGIPLAEGEYGSGMFYNNDAAISSPTAIDHVDYQSWVQIFNNCCDKIFDLALANNDLELANKACKLYKNEVATHFVADTIKGGNYNIAIVTYNDLRKNVAKQKIYEYNEQ